MNGNKELELSLRSIAIDAELLADRVKNQDLWDGEASDACSVLLGKINKILEITKNDVRR